MAVKITIICEDNIEDLSAVEIRNEIVGVLSLNPRTVGVKVSKLSARQYKALLKGN